MREWKNICNKISMTMLIIASLSSYEIILFILHNGITNLILIYHTTCRIIISIQPISPVFIFKLSVDWYFNVYQEKMKIFNGIIFSLSNDNGRLLTIVVYCHEDVYTVCKGSPICVFRTFKKWEYFERLRAYIDNSHKGRSTYYSRWSQYFAFSLHVDSETHIVQDNIMLNFPPIKIYKQSK